MPDLLCHGTGSSMVWLCWVGRTWLEPVPAKQHLSWRSERLPLAHCLLAFCASLLKDPEKECEHIDANVSLLESKQSSWLLSSRHMLTLGGSRWFRSAKITTLQHNLVPRPAPAASAGRTVFTSSSARQLDSVGWSGKAFLGLAWPAWLFANKCPYLPLSTITC